MISMISILVDDRERSSAVMEELRRYDQVEVQVQRLAVGDYCLDKHLIVERKTLPDMMASIVDGRMFRQAMRLVSSEFDPLLILEGTSADTRGARVSREAVQGAMITVSVILGIPVLRSHSPQETAWLMVRAAVQVKKVISGNTHRPGYRPKGRRKRQLSILQGLPRIGPERAERLLDRFGSIQNVINASYDELLSVDGIGKDTARKIQDILNEPPSGYGLKDVSSRFSGEGSENM